ncbi:MAG TPA: twin-arginine translocation signal domain-containing protein [Planctomycetaceae bacterium]|nr:twin-arginine translocation signal domain-containing protein [Planctomycetaceae bacterium]
MFGQTNRRDFLRTAAAGGALVGLGDLAFLSRLRPVSASEAKLDPNVVQLRPEIEPLVKLLEETPRGQLLERVAEEIRRGTSYREVLAALLLAGVRNVAPRPSVGFKFHAVLVVNSAHIASMASPDEDRWLPIFWALDEFKASQARDVQETNWTMAPVKESSVPPAEKAREAFIDAMNRWDEEAADAAVAGLARTAGANELFELFARFGARDFRSIGHKAIYVANAWRTLHCIGWQHAEPVLRSLAYALQNHDGERNPAEHDLSPDRPWRRNIEVAQRIRPDWQAGRLDSKATLEMLDTLRTANDAEACEKAVDLLNAGVSPQSVYDALFLAAGEYLMRQPAIVALHAVTTTNALWYAYATLADDESRRMMLLQNAAFLPLFREAMKGRGRVGDGKLDELEPSTPEGSGDEALADIFQSVSQNRTDGARKALAFLDGQGSPNELIDTARRLIFLKGTNSHDYKFSSAVLEDYYHISPEWRNRFLASGMYNLRGAGDRDNGLVQRTREALNA